MSNSDWNSFNDQPKKGVSFWGKVAIGCGVVLLLLLSSCAGFAWWVSKGSGKKYIAGKINEALEKPWGRITKVTEALQTDSGALELYRNNPALEKNYPTEADFLKIAAIWRDKIATLPIKPPTFDELRDSDFNINSSNSIGENRVKATEISYRMPNGVRLRMRWEDEKLVGIEIN